MCVHKLLTATLHLRLY